MFKGSGTIGCDGQGCKASIMSMMTSSEAGARKSARQAGWSTARGLSLCPACTASHNAAVSRQAL